VCLAVTRQGFGDIWALESFEEADTHPLIQYGDAKMCGPQDILRQYNTLELPRLVGMTGDSVLIQDYDQYVPRRSDAPVGRVRSAAEGYADRIWRALLRAARPVPTDPAEICRIVVMDRKTIKEVKMTDQDTAGQVEGQVKEKKVREPKPDTFPLTGTIHLLQDKEGNQYHGTDRNPKRPGTKAHEAFAKYQDGMSVQQFVDAVGNKTEAFAHLKNDTNEKKAFVRVDA